MPGCFCSPPTVVGVLDFKVFNSTATQFTLTDKGQLLDSLRRLSAAQLGRPVFGVLLSQCALLVMRVQVTAGGVIETAVTGEVDVRQPKEPLGRPIQGAQWLVWFLQQAAGSKLDTCGRALLTQVILEKPTGSSAPTTIIYAAAYPQAAGAGAGAGADAGHRGNRLNKCVVKQVKDPDLYDAEKRVLLHLKDALPADTDCVQYVAHDDDKLRLAVTPHGQPYGTRNVFTANQVADVLTTLKAVHLAGATWGDVRPANIVQFRLKPVIIDFGYGQLDNDVVEGSDYFIASPKFMHWRRREGNSADVLKQRDLDGIIASWLWCASKRVHTALNNTEIETTGERVPCSAQLGVAKLCTVFYECVRVVAVVSAQTWRTCSAPGTFAFRV